MKTPSIANIVNMITSPFIPTPAKPPEMLRAPSPFVASWKLLDAPGRQEMIAYHVSKAVHVSKIAKEKGIVRNMSLAEDVVDRLKTAFTPVTRPIELANGRRPYDTLSSELHIFASCTSLAFERLVVDPDDYLACKEVAQKAHELLRIQMVEQKKVVSVEVVETIGS